MYCSNCGNQIAKDSHFCQICGEKILSTNKIASHKPTTHYIYSTDWTRAKVFETASSMYDILIDEKYFYLISFRKFYGGTIGLLVGLFFYILGAIIGFYIGDSLDKNRRKKIRSAWLNVNGELISDNFEKNIFFKIPIDQMSKRISFNGKYILIQAQEKITIRKSKAESLRLSNYLDVSI